MKVFKFSAAILSGILLSFTLGCLAWDPGWKLAQEPAVKGDVKALLEKAKKIENEADTKEKVRQLITTYEDAYRADPQNLDAAVGAGRYYFFMAYAYSDGKEEKKTNYVKALQFLERAMYLNPEFKVLADKGENVWEACHALKNTDMRAMYTWYLSVGNCWNDCYCLAGRLLNMYWPGRTKKVLDRMTEIDPDWGSGSIYFSWASYYCLLPGILGGDMKKSEENWDKALELGPHMINFYMARATYYHVKRKDRKGFVDDLHMAIAIDPRKTEFLTYPWGIWYQGKAKQMLADTDNYFK